MSIASPPTTGTILDRIAEKKRTRVAARLAAEPLQSIQERALARVSPGFRFRQAIDRPDHMSLIAEVKKASPSKGLICRSFDPVRQAGAYETGGAQAVSVLTEEDFFLGKDEHLEAIAGKTTIPLLRKDFIIDEYQIYEARALGASAVLLIAALLDDRTAARFLEIAERLGLDVLFEVHDLPELVRAIGLDVRIIGINNRDLRTFQVDLGTTARLARIVPSSRMVVSESGIATPEDLAAVYAAGARCALVGETLMRSGEDPEAVHGAMARLLRDVPA